jgi:hypothetical protein
MKWKHYYKLEDQKHTLPFFFSIHLHPGMTTITPEKSYKGFLHKIEINKKNQ